jgi:hypothetical protein
MAGLSEAGFAQIDQTVNARLTLTVDLKLGEAPVLDRMRRELQSTREYRGTVKLAFDDLLIRLVRFVSMRLDASRFRYKYLNEVVVGSEPQEIDLQKDLYDFLGSTGYPAWERDNIASGRTDIVVPLGSFNFVIETKKIAQFGKKVRRQRLSPRRRRTNRPTFASVSSPYSTSPSADPVIRTLTSAFSSRTTSILARTNVPFLSSGCLGTRGRLQIKMSESV